MWKNVAGFESTYEVSDSGQLRSKLSNKILSPFDNGRGYRIIYLYSNKVRRTFRVARLVAQAFLPNEEGKLFVDHVNRNRKDDSTSNLRWVTRNENNDNRSAASGSVCRHCGKKQ